MYKITQWKNTQLSLCLNINNNNTEFMKWMGFICADTNSTRWKRWMLLLVRSYKLVDTIIQQTYNVIKYIQNEVHMIRWTCCLFFLFFIKCSFFAQKTKIKKYLFKYLDKQATIAMVSYSNSCVCVSEGERDRKIEWVVRLNISW